MFCFSNGIKYQKCAGDPREEKDKSQLKMKSTVLLADQFFRYSMILPQLMAEDRFSPGRADPRMMCGARGTGWM